MKPTFFAAACLAVLWPSVSGAGPTGTKAVPGYEAAQRRIAACFADQTADGYTKVNVAIVNDGGRLIASGRQNGACKASVKIPKHKAVTSTLCSAPTRDFADLSSGTKRDGLPGAAFIPGLGPFAGSLPVVVPSGDLFGTSGVSEDQDKACGQTGLGAMSDLLK